MPTYAYRCSECDHAFDIYQSFSDSALTECPECGGKLRKVFGSLGVTFNGSGFYRNDSRAGSGASTSAPALSKSEPAKSTTPAPASTSTSS